MILNDPRSNSPNRISDVALLEPMTRQLVQQIVDAAQQMGIQVMVFETYRSQARQQELFNNGATKLRTVGIGESAGLVFVGQDRCRKNEGQKREEESREDLHESGLDCGNRHLSASAIANLHYGPGTWSESPTRKPPEPKRA